MESFFEHFSSWFESNRSTIITIVLIIAFAWSFRAFGIIFIRKTVKRTMRSSDHKNRLEEKKREETITQIISGALEILIWPITAILVISQLGVNVAPLIAGAGILGLAVGFGAQSLVKDVISGLFIIAENQYRVGDVVKINNETTGTVTKISLRVTILRDLDGIVHTIPNGLIELTSNYTKEYSGINLNVGVSYDSDLDKVIKVINSVGDELYKDEEWKDKIIEPLKFLRVDNFGESSVDLKITGTTQPIKQWEVTGEFRKRLKNAFDKEGIEIPFPQRVIREETKK